MEHINCLEYEQLNRACTWVYGTLLALGARLPPTHPGLYDSTTFYNQHLLSCLDDFGQAFENTNLSTVTISPPVADIPLSHPIGDFGRITPPSNRTANANNSFHQVSKGAHHPYSNSITLLNRRKARQPAATYEPNVVTLQDRLRREGGDQDVVKLVSRVFSNGVTLEALTRRQTREEAAQQLFGQGGGPVYLAFLQPLPLNENDNASSWTRFRCRLCPNNADALSWKHHRDVLRHLKKDHFGLGEMCFQCGKQVYTKGEMSSHRCKAAFG